MQIDAETRDIGERLERARSAERKLPLFREEEWRVAMEFPKLDRILPEQPDFDGIRRTVETDCALSGTRLAGFDPYPPRIRPQNDPYAEIFFDTIVTGSAAATAALMQSLQTERPLMNISRIQMRRTADGWRTRFLLTSYVVAPLR